MDTYGNVGCIPVLLLYPDTKEAALGSPGFREVFRILENAADMAADWGWYDRRRGRIVYECREWRGKYECIAFSVPYELLYSNVVMCLSALGYEPEKRKRIHNNPLIIVGGAAPTINPAVAGAIADIVYRGEAEQYSIETIRQAVAEKNEGAA